MPRNVARLFIIAFSVILGLSSAAFGDTYRIRATADNQWRDGSLGDGANFTHVLKGDRVRWKNPASLERLHDVKSCNACVGRNWDFYEVLSPGEGVRKRFRRSGTYSYRCTLHSGVNDGQCNGMCGVIHVE